MSLKFVCLILAVLIQLAASNPPSKSNYIEQEKSCRDVCSLCSCEGFYCEDECICECQIADEDSKLQILKKYTKYNNFKI